VTDLLNSLNPKQREAVLHYEGPAMVLAGAGSGKTRVLTTRVAWLIQEHQVHPSQILLVTFTNKAAQEMNNRVMELTGSKLPFSGTFHRICATILRRDGYQIGLAPGFSIYDADDQLSLIKQIYKEHGFSVKDYNPKAVKATISTAKNEMITWEEYEKFATGQYQEFTARVYKLYQRALKDQQAVDFDDLMLLTVELFRTNKEVLGKYQDQIQHVLIDEYQDTNKVQYQLTKYLALPQNNIYVVGDFSQSIYAWRGADYRNLLHLKTDFANIEEYRLEQNYRSTQTILDAATNIISQNTDHPVLKLWTENTQTHHLTLFETETGEDEAHQIINTIRTAGGKHTYSDYVILYRTNAQSRPFEEALVRAGIPYRLVGGFKFYERKEIKDLLAYLRLTVNPADSVSRERASKLGKRRLAEFDRWYQAQNFQPEATISPFQVLQEVLRITEYQDLFDKNDPEDVSRLENIQELMNVASQFTDAKVFLENVALVQDDYLADVETGEAREAITLMSLHSAKGLEYPVVFMVGMEDGLLPHSRSLMDKAQMEEERRLCYVGITRAKEQLFFSYARMRWTYGTPTYGLRSRFLRDIPAELIEEVSTVSSHHSENHYSQSGNGYQRGGYFQKKNKPEPPKPTGRHIVIDDDEMNSVLSGEMDIKAFLES
jgi:DNA helicase-2/ATP-dependent DNA helicase PcrA